MKGFHNVWITCFYDKDTNDWNMLWDDSFYEGKNFDTLIAQIKSLSKNKSSKYVIFINNLTLFAPCLPGTAKGEKTLINGSKRLMEKETSNIQFRNFEIFMPFCNEEYLNNEKNGSQFMREYLLNLCKDTTATVATCRYSFSHVFLHKIIHPSLQYVLKENIQAAHRNFWSRDMFDKLSRGNKAGLTCFVNESFIAENTDIYDENSCYTAIMTSDPWFPVGNVVQHKGEIILKAFKASLEQSLWFKFFIPSTVENIPDCFKFFRDNSTDDICIEISDYRLMVDCNYISKKDFLDAITKIVNDITFFCATSGRLHKEFRKALNALYDKKDTLEKGLERDIIKQGLEAIYGKGLQKRDFKDDTVIPGFFSDGMHYFQPHMALHCTAEARYRLAMILKKAGKDIFYFDTDSVHGTGKKLENVIEDANRHQKIMNEVCGANSNIGIWKVEHKNSVELITATKRRIVLDNGKFETKVSGINKKFIYRHIERLQAVGLSDLEILDYFCEEGFGEVEIIVYCRTKNSIVKKIKKVKEIQNIPPEPTKIS